MLWFVLEHNMRQAYLIFLEIYANLEQHYTNIHIHCCSSADGKVPLKKDLVT